MAGGESSSSGSGFGSASLPSSEDLTQPIQFKLDNIPHLTDGIGYRVWCSIATLYLRSHSLWNVVNSIETTPSDPTKLQKWEIRNITVQLFLTSMVDMFISYIVSEAS